MPDRIIYIGSDDSYDLEGENHGADIVTLRLIDKRNGNRYEIELDNCRLAEFVEGEGA